jgi:hypothetical protein
MLVKKTSIDLSWDSNGDFSLDANGDIGKANLDEGRLVKQAMLKRIQSRKGDWNLAPEVGANLVDFIGLPNTRETGQQLQSAVIQSLTEDGTISAGSLQVEVYPLSKERIAIAIAATVPFSSELVYLQVDYDLRNNSIIPRMI